MRWLQAAELASAVVGFVLGLLLMAVGKAIDQHNRDGQRDLNQAEILGELRAGFAGLSGRVTSLETRVCALCEELDEHSRELHRVYEGRH